MKNGGLLTDENGKLSKGKIGGVLLIIAALITAIGKFLMGDGNMMVLGQAIITFALGLGIFGIRDARKTEISD